MVQKIYDIAETIYKTMNEAGKIQWCPVSFLHVLKDDKKMKKSELFA